MFSGIIDIDRTSKLGLAEQIYRQIRLAVRDGRLVEGQKLPSSRTLAKNLGVSRNTINQAYDLLKSELILTVRSGAAASVASRQPLSGPIHESTETQPIGGGLSERGVRASEDPRRDFRVHQGGILQSGVPALDLFPRDAWARSLRRSSRLLTEDDVFYTNIGGLPRFRSQLADYLSKARGVKATAEQILVTTSTQASLSLLSQCLADPGDDVFVEDPGYPGARVAFNAHRLALHTLDIDPEGALLPDRASKLDPRLIYLTPSHQFPMGYCMSLSRRLAFIDYARDKCAFILEDDYDSEFLVADHPIASLQGLASGSEVIYLGTFAKTMLPGIRVAYMVVPKDLSAPLSQAIRNTGVMASVPIQAALADFMESGQYYTHLRKTRSIYDSRGKALASELNRQLGNRIQIVVPFGGVQLVVKFALDRDDISIAQTLQKAGVGVSALSLTYLGDGAPGLIIGYSQADEGQISTGVQEICKVLK